MKRAFLGAMALSVAVYATAAHAVDRDFVTENRTGATITHLYVSPVRVNTWGPDQLGSSVIPNGGNFTLHFEPSNFRGVCNFDIKITREGQDSVLSGINLCTITHLTFSRNGSGNIVFSTRVEE